MEQFRQLGEVFGSLQALMVFQDEIRINRRQCLFLFDIFRQAFDAVAAEIRGNLRLDEKQTRWKALEHPIRALAGIVRGGEQYIKQCMETSRDWWARAILLDQNNDVVEEHVHRLLWCIPVVFEAVEVAAEVSGCKQEETQRKRIMVSKKYERDWLDPRLFEAKFGRQYLVSPEIVNRLETVRKEDRWALMEMVSEKSGHPMAGNSPNKHEQRMAELLAGPKGKLFPTSVLVGSKDYQVKRRLGNGSHYKEIQWRGESFAARHFFGDIEPLIPEINLLSSLTHPNVMHILCAFSDEDRKECFLLMELMSRDLCNHTKEITSPRRKLPFSLPVAVDVMLQIARGMEYLHSHRISHGKLNPSSVLIKTSNDNHLHVKITGFGLSSLKSYKNNTNEQCIWCAPEVLQTAASCCDDSRFDEKADVYSFAMVCFELLTGKVPFEDLHLRGDKMSRNIRAGERPLFPFPTPKYLTNLTKRCWQADPSQRPSFSTICRILRYIKRFLLLNPADHSQPDAPTPAIDYYELESSLRRRFPSWVRKENVAVTQVPFQMFAYRVVEREKTSLNYKDKVSDSGSDEASACGDENGYAVSLMLDDSQLPLPSRSPPKSSSEISKRVPTKKVANGKANKQTALQAFQQKKGRALVPAHLMACGRNMRTHSDSQLPPLASPRPGRKASGHSSDSELA